jgi:hypothetical protein
MSVCLLRRRIGGQRLQVVYCSCEYPDARIINEPMLILLFRIVNCDVDPETHGPVISCTKESYSVIQRELGLPSTYQSHMTSNIIRTTSFSAYKENVKLFKGV